MENASKILERLRQYTKFILIETNSVNILILPILGEFAIEQSV